MRSTTDRISSFFFFLSPNSPPIYAGALGLLLRVLLGVLVTAFAGESSGVESGRTGDGVEGGSILAFDDFDFDFAGLVLFADVLAVKDLGNPLNPIPVRKQIRVNAPTYTNPRFPASIAFQFKTS